MYNVGDKVVYPMHGAGVIDSIEEKEILGEKQSYYILKMPGEVKVMVPISTAEQHGIRNVIDNEIADVVRNLSFKQKEKGLSTGEKKMLHNAKQILVSELVLAEHATQDEVEELVDNKINTSFAMFKTDTNMEVSTGSIVNKFIPFDNNSSQND